MKKQSLIVTACVAPVLALAAVPVLGGGSAAPHESVLATVQAVQRNDLQGLLESMLTDEQIGEMEQEWNRTRKEPIEPGQAMQFQMVMSMLTAPGAEDQLMAMVTPKLEEMRPQVSMMVGMFSGMAQAGLAQDQNLDASEKEKAGQVLDRIGKLLLENDITSEASARKAVGIVCAAARELELTSLEQVQALSFHELLGKGDVALGASKDLLAIYGVDLDGWLDTVEAETVSESDDHAVVRVEFEILGVSESEELEMVRVDGRWIRKEALELSSAR